MIVDGPDNHKIDCMFFPCTQGEDVRVFNTADSKDDENISYCPQYMTKPTIIMCNPNALFY